jgi:hypothetical protein
MTFQPSFDETAEVRIETRPFIEADIAVRGVRRAGDCVHTNVPWTPRTLHRQTVLDTSRSFSNEVLDRFAQQVASRIRKPAAECAGYVLALNPADRRTAVQYAHRRGLRRALLCCSAGVP